MSGYALWNPATVYSINDVVDYDSKLWVSKQSANVNKQPDISPAWWSQVGGGGGSLTTLVAGNGITVSGSGTTRTIATNLSSADARLTFTTGVGTEIVLTNTSPAAVAAGAGLSASGTNPTGITIAMPNVGTANTYAYPSSITTDAQGRVSAVSAGAAPPSPTTITTPNGAGVLAVPSGNNYTLTSSLVAGSGITLTPAVNSTNITISASSVASKMMYVVDFPTAGANSWVVPAGVSTVVVEAIGGGGGCGFGSFTSQPTNGSPTIITALAGTITALGGVIPNENQTTPGTGANYWVWTNGQANSGKGGFGSYWTAANGNGQTIAGSDGQRIVRSIATTPGETISVSVGVAGVAPGTAIGGANGGTGYAIITYYV